MTPGSGRGSGPVRLAIMLAVLPAGWCEAAGLTPPGVPPLPAAIREAGDATTVAGTWHPDPGGEGTGPGRNDRVSPSAAERMASDDQTLLCWSDNRPALDDGSKDDPDEKTGARRPGGPIRILFIGNSYTFANDLPAMLAKLSVAGRRRRIVHALEAPGGCTFEQHVVEGRAAARIAAGRWDYVVLQEQSMMPIAGPAQTLEFGGRLDRAARAAGASTLFFQTWARAGNPEMQDGLSATYAELARRAAPAADGRPGATVAAVGEAWRRALEMHPAPSLHAADGSHPTPAGTYLAACVFYAVIHGESPIGLSGRLAGIDDASARRLQEAAWAAVRAGLPAHAP